MVSFAVQKLLSLSRSHLFIFAFIFFTLGDWSKKYSAIYVKESSILFFSGSLIVSFAVQKFLSLIRSHLFTFVFILVTLGGGS